MSPADALILYVLYEGNHPLLDVSEDAPRGPDVHPRRVRHKQAYHHDKEHFIHKVLSSSRPSNKQYRGRKLGDNVSRAKRLSLLYKHDHMMDEAVDSFAHADAAVKRYHYDDDPRQQKVNKSDRWYQHPDGHSLFVYFEPESGVSWHHYQMSEGFGKDKPYAFWRGRGVNQLIQYLDTVHGAA